MPLTACSHHACPCCCTACERDRLRAELEELICEGQSQRGTLSEMQRELSESRERNGALRAQLAEVERAMQACHVAGQLPDVLWQWFEARKEKKT